jgi:hypothetical protein
MLLSHPHDQRPPLLIDLRPPQSLPWLGAVTLLGHECAVPGQNGIRLHDRGHLLQGLLPQLLADLGEDFALVGAEAHASLDLMA